MKKAILKYLAMVLLLTTISIYFQRNAFGYTNLNLIQRDNDESHTLTLRTNTTNYNHWKGDDIQQNQPLSSSSSSSSSSSPPPRPHPHAGARDSSGRWGYVADITRVRRKHLDKYSTKNFLITKDDMHFQYVCETEVGKGWEGPNGGLIVMKKVEISKLTSLTNVTTKVSHSDRKIEGGDDNNKSKLPKLLCSIYTFERNHNRIEAIADTWGWKCDGFLPASNFTNETIGTVDLPHIGEESYESMWQKTRSIWSYIYDNYIDDYDFFWLGGDDYFLIVENLINYLATLDQTKTLFLGSPVPHFDGKHHSIFCGGGPGYVLNRVALKRVIEESFPTCLVSKNILFYFLIHFFYISNKTMLLTVHCFHKQKG